MAATGCGHAMMMLHGAKVARPPATEFGTGPRASASHRFTGVRFNMGGWWEFRLAIDAASASDVVTFHLAL